jgi:hypothetical protein
MLVTINKKPIEVKEEPETPTFSPVYLTVSTIGFTLILYLMDYICNIFFFIHPLPWIQFVGHIISFLGGLL